MPGKITSSEIVAILHYLDRWDQIINQSGDLLLYTDQAYANYIRENDGSEKFVEILYHRCLENSDEDTYDALTMAKYFVLSFLVYRHPQELIPRYNAGNYKLNQQQAGLLQQLFTILKRIIHIITRDRNQIIAQVLSFCNDKEDDPFTAFCTKLKTAFPLQILTPLPSPGFLKRKMVTAVLTGHQEPVKAIRVFNKGRQLISIGNGSLHILELSTGKIMFTLDITEDSIEVTSLAVVEEQKIILAVFREGVAIAWKWRFHGDRLYLDEINRIQEERAFLRIIHYREGLSAIATTQGHLILWNFHTNSVEKIPTGLDSLHSVAYKPDGDLIVCGGAHLGTHEHKVFKILKTGEWQERYCSPMHEWPVDEVHVTGTDMVASRANYIVSQYDTKSDILLLQKDYKRTLHASCFVPEKDLLLFSQSNKLYILNLVTGEEKKLVTEHHGMITAILVQDGGRQVITASGDQTIRIWDGELLLSTRDADETHIDKITAIIKADEYDYLISSSHDGHLIIWGMDTAGTLNTPSPLKKIAAHTHWISGIQYLRQQRELVSYSWDHYIHFWSLPTFEKTRSFFFEGKHITHLHYHYELNKILFVEFEKTGWIYDIKEGSLHQLPLAEKITKLLYKQGSEYWLITGNGSILSFDLATEKITDPTISLTNKCMNAFYQSSENHSADYPPIESSPIDLYIVDDEKTLHRWNPETKNIEKLVQMTAMTTGLATSENGHLITIGGTPHYQSDNTVRIHDRTGRTLSQFTLESPLTACVYSEKNKLVGVGDAAGGIYFFRLLI